ncbi:putative bifunctional diguanylate cyclase/phosphodiesterase [Craterilacuibacter sp.]|uniref:putative bifunctional diguanylate cyclase/phosphodiesterase n=1 Tax=Craterilacuibacter sp. TaxID=2870909 RepID=UPI003F3677BA
MTAVLDKDGALVRGAHDAVALLRQAGALAAAAWVWHEHRWQCLAGSGEQQALLDPGASSGAQAITRYDVLMDGKCCGALLWLDSDVRLGNEACKAAQQLLSARIEAAVIGQTLAGYRLQQDLLLETSMLASQALTLEAFLSRLQPLLARLIPAQDFSLTLSDDGGSLLHLPYTLFSHETGRTEVSLSAALAGAVHAGGKTRVLDTRRILAFCAGSGIAVPADVPRFWFGLPLTLHAGQERVVVAIQIFDPARRYDQQSLRIFLRLARHIAALLAHVCERSSLMQALRARGHELEGSRLRLHAEQGERRHHQQLMRALFGIANLSNRPLPLADFLAGVHHELHGLLSCSGCMVALYDAEQDALSFPYGADAFLGDQPLMRTRAGPVEQVLHSGRTLLLNGHALLMSIAGMGGKDMASWLGVPLYSDKEIKGVLAVCSHDRNLRYGHREQELLECVAEHVGAALTRLQAAQSLQLANSALEARVRERTLELDEVNARLKHDNLHDTLTGLPNRAHFNKTLLRCWQAYKRDERERFAVLFIDLDRFKLVNDTLGHHAGDALLGETGARIRHCLRPNDFLARLGGDEFALLLNRMDSVARCEQIAQRIVEEFERPMMVGEREVFATVSIGVVLADGLHYRSAEELLRDADMAMYRTKQSGRHGYTLFNHDLRENQADLLALEADLRRALEADDQLVPYYQPFIDSVSLRLTGFETLVRWHHPERGMVSPGEFLPMAQASGLIQRLDRYMIEQACTQLASWRRSGRVDEALSLHINLSSENLRDAELPPWMDALLSRLGLPPALVYLEVTESALIDVPEVAAEVMQALHAIGVRLALDDFGTGYSALSYLHRYRFDLLKIDQAFVREVDIHAESSAIVRAILALAQALHLDVVAEGVETSAQVAVLQDMACPKLQGFYFAKPQPAAAIAWDRLLALEKNGHCYG